jgi:hypothetical protein
VSPRQRLLDAALAMLRDAAMLAAAIAALLGLLGLGSFQ